MPSSLLNVSNASKKPEEFGLKGIEVLVDSEAENWFKRAYVGKVLGLAKKLISVEGLDIQEMPQRDDIKAMVSNPYPWPGPKDHQNKTDKFLSSFGVRYVIEKSQKDKGKALKKHILKDIVPRGFDARIEEIQEKHQQAITDLDNQIKTLESRNEKHQKKILRLNEEIDDLIANRHVARRGYFDNVLRFIKKIAEKDIHITLFNVSTGNLKNISDGLNFVIQTLRWLTNVMIQTPFTDGTGLNVK